VIASAGVAHVHFRTGVDDLVAEGADAEVGPLGQEHDAVGADAARAADEAAVDGPEACDDAGNGGFADAVGAREQEVVAGSDDDGEGFDESVAAEGEDCGSDDGDGFEPNAVEAFVDGALDVGEGEEFRVGAARWEVGVCVHAVEGGDQGVDAGGIAGEFGEVFNTVHHPSAGVGEGEHEAFVGDELLHPSTLTATGLAVVGQFQDAAKTTPRWQEHG